MEKEIYDPNLIWTITTSLIGTLIIVITYFLKVWKTEVDNKLKKLEDKNIKDDMMLVKDYVTIADCKETEMALKAGMSDMKRDIDALSKKIDRYHVQVMYEFGIRNGLKKSLKKGGDEDEH
jgi:hypothetical protein